MKKFLTIIFTSVFIFFVAAPVATTTLSPSVSAASSGCDTSFLGIPPWYRGLTTGSGANCTVISPNDPSVGGLQNFIWRIVLNGIQMALVISAYIAIFFILYGGFLYITGGGNAAQIEKGRKSIFNAVIGLVIAMGSIAITNFIFTIIGNASTTPNGIPTLTGEQLLRNGLNITYFAAGTVAVIVIIIAGINYVTSTGDAGKVTKAKNMLTYAVVGLIIVLVAFAITNFVIGRFS